MGKRLKELTKNATKCMVEVNGITMIQRMLSILDRKQLRKIVVVVGYEGDKLIEYIESLGISTSIEFIKNDIYNKTNNIYSLYLARNCLLQDDTLLLESDLIFEEAVLDRLIHHPYPSLALVAKYESWMDGTVVELDEQDNILCFRSKKEFRFEDIDHYFKTVNLYKFSKEFSQTRYVPFLEAYRLSLGDNEYYEQVLKVITSLDKPEIKAVRLDDETWYEIDDIQDLDIAESLFSDNKDKLKKISNREGGYWRYPHLKDFSTLSIPYFPNPKIISELKANMEFLLKNQPSGQQITSLLAAKYFGLHKQNIVVGNGAAELIKSLMSLLPGKTGMAFPTFEEYPNRRDAGDIIAYCPENADFTYTADDLMKFFADREILILALVNPDNPSGNFIEKADLLRLADWAEKKGIRLIVDESFVDFAETAQPSSLLDQELLTRYPGLIVVKSISKSFGVPGLRLGGLASGDEELIEKMKKDVAIWNINSFAEFYMQIFEKYQSEYARALKQFYEVRRSYVAALRKIHGLRVIDSQANYLLCEVLSPCGSTSLTETLLNDYNILIKDLSTKNGFHGAPYIRIAVKTPEENAVLIDALHQLLN